MRNKLREMGTTPHGDDVVSCLSCATILPTSKQWHCPMKLTKLLAVIIALMLLLDLNATPEFTISDHGVLEGVELNGETDITIPSSVTMIGNKVFEGCWALKSVTSPDSVISIWEYAFADCRNLASVTIGAGVTAIENGVFRNCESLTSVVVPRSVTVIAGNTFDGCRNLTSIVFGGNAPQSSDFLEFQTDAKRLCLAIQSAGA